MSRVHQRLCASVVLGSAMAGGFGLPAMAALYHADGTIGATLDGVDQHPYKDYSLDLGLQAGGQVNYDLTGVHAQADSIADGYGVRSHTFSQINLPFVGGNYRVGAGSTAIATFSDMVVSGPVGGTVPTSINFDLSGGMLHGSGADPGSVAAVAATQVVVWVYINGALVSSGSVYEKVDTRFDFFTNITGMLSSWGAANPRIVTPNFDVQSGVPFDVTMRLTTSADTNVSSGNGTGGTAEANADFGHTLSFALDGPVFNLPAGYTANSPDAHIVGNQVVAAPGDDADFDEDGEVDAEDLGNWQTGFGMVNSAMHNQGDADGDLDVDGGDVLVWQRQLAGDPPAIASSASVPEPLTKVLFLLGYAALGILRRHGALRRMSFAAA